ncbi:MAG: hypothetical protein KDA84_16515, partial [Planctomycetaceae bacterium]|nr:hypothetical protein [Planctomycetaceae bacterium]
NAWSEVVIALVTKSRKDLSLPTLKWYVSQQPPTDDKAVNNIDVTAELERAVTADEHLIYVKVFDLPKQEKQLVIDTRGTVWLGETIARKYTHSQ